MVRLDRDLPPELAGRSELSAAEYRALADTPPRRKYGNTPTEYNGVVYHSALEAACAAELDRLMATDPPLVARWERQVSRPLGRRGLVKLVVDFDVYLHPGAAPVPVEAKGRETPESRVKRLWFAESYGVPVRVVRAPAEIAPLLRALGGG
jgi:hypothetical protein